MNEDIIKWARDAGFGPACAWEEYRTPFERFAALARADEREACAKVCENIGHYDENVDDYYSDTYASAVRARSHA